MFSPFDWNENVLESLSMQTFSVLTGTDTPKLGETLRGTYTCVTFGGVT